MRRWGMILAGAAVFALVASQILLPSIGERRIESRLTEGGGSADVTLGAVPALRLLFGEGERFQVEARDLDLSFGRDQEVFSRLDGFSLVDISIADSTAGPFRLSSFELHRDGGGPYTLTADGRTTPASLVDSGIENLGLPGGGFAGLALDLLGIGNSLEVPIQLDMKLSSDAGRVQVVSGGGTVGGIPTGPLAELITGAIVLRL